MPGVGHTWSLRPFLTLAAAVDWSIHLLEPLEGHVSITATLTSLCAPRSPRPEARYRTHSRAMA